MNLGALAACPPRPRGWAVAALSQGLGGDLQGQLSPMHRGDASRAELSLQLASLGRGGAGTLAPPTDQPLHPACGVRDHVPLVRAGFERRCGGGVVQNVGVISFAEKLDALVASLVDADGSAVSGNRFVAMFNEVSPVRLSTGYFSELRTGVVTNPRMDLVEALAEFFQISPSYFFPSADDDLNVERVRLLGSMRRANVTRLAARTDGLSADALHRIIGVIEEERSKHRGQRQ